jgi:CRP/FNR family transcriptional regulator, cyclic AMP receptor protein
VSPPKSRKGQTENSVSSSAPNTTPANHAPFDVNTFLAKVGEGRSLVEYSKNRVVFAQGDKADAVFYLRKGKVKLTVVSTQGKEAVVALLGEGEFFGEGCLIGQPLRMATTTTLTPCAILRLEKAAMVRVLHTQPTFATRFISHLLARNIRIEEDLVDQLFNSAEKRLARVLLLLASFGKEGKPELVIPKISQETLAEMIGTTRSRVSFFMNKFRKLGFIHYNDGLEVHSSLLNIVLHD